MRETESEEEIAAAKKEAEKRGESSIFETVTVAEPEPPLPSLDATKPLDASPKEDSAVQIERKGDSVRSNWIPPDIQVTGPCSTNTRRLSSKSHIAS